MIERVSKILIGMAKKIFGWVAEFVNKGNTEETARVSAPIL
jgi:hypothetical protein